MNKNSSQNRQNSWFKNFLLGISSLLFSVVIVGGIWLFFLILSLPNIDELKDVKLQVPLKIYSLDNKLIGEFGTKRLTPIKIEQVPKLLIKAVLDTEDRRFYEHQGVDFIGLGRAAKNLFLTGKKTEGASTITMQLARNFFLSPQKTYTRKLKEILLAFKIEREFNKNAILELYLNKVYFGQRAYGVAAAAEVYYGKALSELTLPEMAMIAGLPQAPSRDNPLANPKVALERRNHVLKRMLENNDITLVAYEQAIKIPLNASNHGQLMEVYAPYVAEMVRAQLIEKYGEKIYGLGYKVYTTIDSHVQDVANKTLRDGLIAYTKRHGYGGPEGDLGRASDSSFSNWRMQLQDIPAYNSLYPAAVIKGDNNIITVLLADGKTVDVSSAWAQYPFSPGMVVRLYRTNNGHFELTELPKINGALVALNPKNGGITALVGGFSYAMDQFNCAIQADRQPGSSIKPFIYAAALEKGYTLSTVINDAPIILPNTSSTDMWRPQNFNKEFLGPTRLRVALTESRNVVSVRLLQAIGISYAIDYIQKFGFPAKNLPVRPSLALGTASVSPIEMAMGYAVFANGGYAVKPFLVNRIEDENGKIVFQETIKAVPSSQNEENTVAAKVIDPQVAYLITDVMKNIVLRDAAKFALKLTRYDLAGKTGTTNEQNDGWFVGFNGDMVTAVWIGYNTPRSIHEYGAQVAFPIWLSFMQQSLRGYPENAIEEPANIISVKIDPASGLLADSEQDDAIFELFTKGTVPTEKARVSAEGNSNRASSSDDADELNGMELF
jgi:penicillin-binding protein 1A